MKMLDVFDDATGKLVGSVPSYNGDEMLEMVEKAYVAQKEWAKVPIFEKGRLLYKFIDLVDEHRTELAELMAREIGKRITGARTEVKYSADIGREVIEKCKHTYGEVFTNNAEGYERNLVFTRREPLGVVAAVIPFNFPVELTIQKVVPALMMGNTILVKPPTAGPLSVKLLVDLCHKAGIPEDVVQFVHGTREDCTKYIFTNKKIDCLALTGSTAAGAEMMRNAADTIKNVILELGGNDVMIVREDVADDPELLIKALLGLQGGRISENNGQVCASPKRLLVHRKVKDQFLKGLLPLLDSLKRGHALDDAEITRLVSEKAAIKVEKEIQLTVEQGGKVIYGGTRNGATIEPTVIDNVTVDMDIATDMEVFGPVVPVITFDTDEEALEITNASKYGLSSCVFTNDMKKAFWFAQHIKSAACVVNGTSAERHHEQPFGGCKSTGIGHEGAGFSAEEFSTLKTYNINDVIDVTDVIDEDGIGNALAGYWADKAELIINALEK